MARIPAGPLGTVPRTLFFLMVFGSILFAPFWLVVVLAFIGLVSFVRWWEILVLALVTDLLYRGGAFYTGDEPSVILPFVTIAALGVLCIAEFLRGVLRYPH